MKVWTLKRFFVTFSPLKEKTRGEDSACPQHQHSLSHISCCDNERGPGCVGKTLLHCNVAGKILTSHSSWEWSLPISKRLLVEWRTFWFWCHDFIVLISAFGNYSIYFSFVLPACLHFVSSFFCIFFFNYSMQSQYFLIRRYL